MKRSWRTSPAAGIRSGDPFMVDRGVILTAQTARGPDGTSGHVRICGQKRWNVESVVCYKHDLRWLTGSCVWSYAALFWRVLWEEDRDTVMSKRLKSGRSLCSDVQWTPVCSSVQRENSIIDYSITIFAVKVYAFFGGHNDPEQSR